VSEISSTKTNHKTDSLPRSFVALGNDDYEKLTSTAPSFQNWGVRCLESLFANRHQYQAPTNEVWFDRSHKKFSPVDFTV